MKKIILKIDGMSCSACSNSLEKYLNKQEGINATVNLVMASASINYDENKYSLSDLDKLVEHVGFKSLGEYKFENINNKNAKSLFIYTIIFILYLIFMFSNMIFKYLNIKYFGIISLIFSFVFLVYGFDIITRGIKNIKYRSPNMDTLVTIGVLSSFIYSFVNLILILFLNYNLYLYFESVIMIIYFIKLGRFIDIKSKEKTTSAIKDLVLITPEKAIKIVNNKKIEVPIDEVKKDDILVSNIGMKFSVDGIITKGVTYVDESFITGESNPVKKSRGDKVLAGSLNISSNVLYKASKIGRESTISEIVRLVNESINTKPKIGKLADKIGNYFVKIVILIAFLTFIFYLIFIDFNTAIIKFVTVLVISCPCAMGLATPISFVIANGTCAKLGILIKKSEILEIIQDTKTIVFDKTGTLTYGNLRISRLANYSNYKNDKLLNIVKSLEINSNHPIANAFSDYESKYEVLNFKNLDGMGISGIIGRTNFYVGNNKLVNYLKLENTYLDIENNFLSHGNTVLYIIENKKIIGLIGIKDTIREYSKKVINELRKMKLDIVILSGDNIEVTSNISKSLNIDNIHASLLPKEKQEFIKEYKKSGKVMMIGDGINDALGLVESDISVSVNGTEVAKNSSDVILLNSDLNNIINLFKISKKTIKIIKENLIWAFLYNMVMIPISIIFFNNNLSPSLASIMMIISSLTVIINSFRLRKI